MDRVAALERLEGLDRSVAAAADLAALKPIFYQLEEIIRQCPGDDQIQSRVAEIKQHLLARGMKLKEAAAAPAPFESAPEPEAWPAAPPPAVEPWPFPSPSPAPSSTQAPFPAAPPPPLSADYLPEGGGRPAPAVAPPAPAAGALPWKRALLAGGAIGLVLFAALVWLARKGGLKGPGARPAGGIAVEVRTAPPGASIRVNNQVRCTSNCRIDVPAGNYQLQAFLDGYEPGASSLTVTPGFPVSVNLVLQPLAQSVRVFTDLESGKVTLDDQPAGDLQEGQLVLDRVAPGAHNLKVTGKGGEAAFSFTVAPGASAAINGPVSAKNLLAVLVSGFGPAAQVRSSSVPVKVKLDGQPAGEAAASGLDLRGIAAGEHELTLGEGSDQRKFVVGFGPAPVLTAFLKLDLNAGTLVVVTGEDDVKVFLNGKEYRRTTKRGQLRILLGVRRYAVRVAKDGFLAEAEQSVEIAKGEETKLEFKLRPVPMAALLHVRGAAPGAQVLLDGAALGTVQTDGTFSASSISPGDHTIELRRERFAPRRMQRQFRAGEAVQVGGADVALERLPATLRINVTPADARVTIRRSDESQARPVTERTLRLPEGSYVVAASAPKHAERSATVQLAAGEARSVDLQLAGEVAAAPQVKTGGMADWDNPGGWVKEAQWLVHKGGNFVTYRTTPTTGTFVFTAALLKGRRLRWFVNYVDAKNYAFFEMDKKFFYRKDVTGGRTQDLGKVQHNLEQDRYYTLQIDIAPGSVVHKFSKNDRWTTLDAWSQPGRNFSSGKFGFLIQGSDQVGLSNFSFIPR